jgi:hypothetical protein
MKKIIAAIIVCFSLSVHAHAQTNSTDTKHGMEEMKQVLKDSLQLTDVQVDSVISIRKEFMGKIQSIMKDSSVSADQRREQLKPLREEMKTRLSTILTKEQMKKMRGLQQEMHKGNIER